MSQKDLVQIILEVFKKEDKPIYSSYVVKTIKDKDESINKNKIYKTIDDLVNKQYLKLLKNNKLVLDYIEYKEIPNSHFEASLITITKNNVGFVKSLETEEDFFIHAKDLNSALVKDKVLCVLLDVKEQNQTPQARVIKVLERKKTSFAATYINNKVYIDDQKFYLNPILDHDKHIPNNSKILIHLKKIKNNNAYFDLKEIIGKISEPKIDINSIILDHDFELERNKEVIEIANNLKYDFDEYNKKIRKDNTKLNYVTIDPETSKDMDDAIFVIKNNDHFLLSVSIADVSYYVRQDTKLDSDAYNRGNSIYLVDRTIGMLPENISNNICSLNPYVDRFCLTVDMKIDLKGNLISKIVYPSVINSKAKLSYDQVDSFFENNSLEGFNDNTEIEQVLKDSKELYKILRNKKNNEGFIDLEIKEYQIVIDELGKPIDIVLKARKDSHRMIEDFMTITNESIAQIAIENKLPFIFRNHDKPSLEKINRFFIEFVKNNFKSEYQIQWTTINSKDFANLINYNQDHPEIDTLRLLVLKSMEKASYMTNNIGHYGLNSEMYSHFTAPIRRYSDLIVHRILWSYLFDTNFLSIEQKNNLKNNLDDICVQCNSKEVDTLSLEREVFSYKSCEYMEQFLNNVFIAKITSVKKFGMFVEIDKGIEGLISLSSIKDDFLEFDEKNETLISKNTNKIYTLGKKLKVKLEAVNRMSSKIDFLLIGTID